MISNAILKPISDTNSTLLTNTTCSQCLCYSNLAYSAINCFTNNSCQLISQYPLTYDIVLTLGARLYFPRQIFPNRSQGCMPNINILLSKLTSGNRATVNISSPSELLMDSLGYISTVDQSRAALRRFNITNLTPVDSLSVDTSSQMAIGYDNGMYYSKAYSGQMFMINSTTLTIVNTMASAPFNRARSMIFINNSQTMIVTSYGSNSLLFFNQVNTTPTNYTYVSSQTVNYSGPYGIWKVNDSFFYVTSYDDNSIYSYSRISISWRETFVFQVSNVSVTSGVTHLTIDKDNRIWISSRMQKTLVYDQQGSLLGSYTIPNAQIFDIKILDNYVMFFSDPGADRIIRIDPNI
ncbi:unnamed protein product [Adineta ricciae]|uniref:Uncharacterized protein n=1 Tax=Adineta ricciae TaxID=249248 RepID=A0A815KNA9_ADIRI|nr:unnamed protein product [Adineta ricciae]